MVAKLISELAEGRNGQFKPARVIYTGTTRKYLKETLQQLSEFRHSGNDVYLDSDPWTPMSYARRRAIFYIDMPAVLVVDTDKLERNVYFNGMYRTEALDIGSFLPYEIKLDYDGKLTIDDYLSLRQMGDRIRETPEENILQELNQYLLEAP